MNSPVAAVAVHIPKHVARRSHVTRTKGLEEEQGSVAPGAIERALLDHA
jgi:hypothetical protein